MARLIPVNCFSIRSPVASEAFLPLSKGKCRGNTVLYMASQVWSLVYVQYMQPVGLVSDVLMPGHAVEIASNQAGQ